MCINEILKSHAPKMFRAFFFLTTGTLRDEEELAFIKVKETRFQSIVNALS